MEPATSADVRELATAVRDLADSVIVLSERLGKLDARVDGMGKDLAVITPPTATFFETRNREHAQAEAEVAEAVNRKRATMDEWLSWLTPKRAAGIIAALVTLWGTGAPERLKAVVAAILEASP